MGGQLAAVEWTSTAEVFQRLQAILDVLDIGVINRLVADCPRCLRFLVKVNGNSISPLLSSRIRTPRAVHVRPGEVPEFTVEEDAALMRGVARIGSKWSRLLTLDPVLADRGPYVRGTGYRGQRRCGPPPEGRDEDEDAADREDFEEAEDEPTPRDGGSPSATTFFSFCLYHQPRLAAANPSLGAPPIARLLAAEWIHLLAADREVWRAPAPPRRTRGKIARRG
jgi:hypothetical protein